MRKIVFGLAFAASLFAALCPTAQAGSQACFGPEDLVFADKLDRVPDIPTYADKNQRMIEAVSLDACGDDLAGIKVSAEWLRVALPKSQALNLILRLSQAEGLKPWRVLLAINARLEDEKELGPAGVIIAKQK